MAKKISFIAMSIVCLLISVPFIILSFTNNIIFIIAFIAILILPLISLLPVYNSSLKLIMPLKLVINKNKIVSIGENFHEERDLSRVKKVIDYGDWYQIFFYFGYRSQKFICQKDLIVEGTIEDFEKLFRDKIKKAKGI